MNPITNTKKRPQLMFEWSKKKLEKDRENILVNIYVKLEIESATFRFHHKVVNRMSALVRAFVWKEQHNCFAVCFCMLAQYLKWKRKEKNHVWLLCEWKWWENKVN